MQSCMFLRLLAAGCQLQRTYARHFGAQVQAVCDRLRVDTARHPVFVTLVKADAQAPPLTIQQAL